MSNGLMDLPRMLKANLNPNEVDAEMHALCEALVQARGRGRV